MKKKRNISQKDINIWNEYIKDPKDIIDKDLSKKRVNNNLRFKYDLHGHNLLEANKKVKEIIYLCLEKNYREILFITGKGIHSNVDTDVYISKDLSKLKHSVPEFIKSSPELFKYVSSMSTASREDGGEGAITIKLKKL